MRNAGKYEKCKTKASGMATFVLCSGCSVRALFSTIPHLLVVCGCGVGFVFVWGVDLGVGDGGCGCGFNTRGFLVFYIETRVWMLYAAR